MLVNQLGVPVIADDDIVVVVLRVGLLAIAASSHLV
jgi:hypothetical protein